MKRVFTFSPANRINLAERLAAAYVSYVRGHRGMDRTLRTIRGRKLGQYWLTAADTVFQTFSTREGSLLRFDGPFSTRPKKRKE